MQNDNNRSFLFTIEKGIDMFINLGSIYIAYIFAVLIFGEETVSLQSTKLMFLIFAVVLFQTFTFVSFKIYKPIPFAKTFNLILGIIEANLVFYAAVELIVFIFASDAYRSFMLIWLLIAFGVSTAILVFKKRMLIYVVAALRKRHFHLRRVVIVGNNAATTADFVKQVGLNPQYGIMIVGYVGDKIGNVVGCEKLGGFGDLERILDEYHPHEVVFAIDAYDKKRLIGLVNLCDDRCIKVYFLPVIYGFFKSGRQLSSIGTLPVINAHSSPLDSPANAFLKRCLDIVGSLILIVLTSPIMLVAAIGVKLSSPGPILFKQERVGKLGKPFTMLKFRSMKVNVASDKTWTTDNDPRKTRFGTFMRKTSIDELPQLFNVLAGSMSLVGPRPEIPHFVEYFKDVIPLYMVKHYVKPGLTGLAQVRGLRGDTSVEDRILADIEYIENWSFLRDIAIILQTPFKAINKNERYVKNEMAKGIDTSAAEVDERLAETIAARDAEHHSSVIKKAATEVTGDEKKGKILYAASTISHINNFHLDYIAALRAEGYEVKVMARGAGADFDVPFEKKLLSSANTACRSEIKRILAEEKFDIAILNTTLAAFHIRYAMPRKTRPRVVNIVHGYLFSRHIGFVKRNLLLLCEKAVAGKTDAIIVMNEEDKNIANWRKLCREKVYFTRGMGAEIAPPAITPAEIRKEQGAEGKFVMAFVGELSERKNQAFLISSMPEIRRRIPNAVLWLIGEGSEKDRELLGNLALSLELGDAVRFLGRKDNPFDYMRACDLYVSASRIEGMPFNIIEAMGCGCVCIATRIKGHEDLIIHGKGGYLYEFGDRRRFVELVETVHSGKGTASPEAAIAVYRDYSFEKVFDHTLATVKESIGK